MNHCNIEGNLIMQLLESNKYFSAWSTWVLGAVAVTPVLSQNMEIVHSLIPAQYQPYFITVLGIIGLLVRAIKQTSVSGATETTETVASTEVRDEKDAVVDAVKDLARAEVRKSQDKIKKSLAKKVLKAAK